MDSPPSSQEGAHQGFGGSAMTTPCNLVLIGGGEHATVVVDAARSRPDLWRVTGFFNSGLTPKMQMLGIPWLGDDPGKMPSDALPIVATGSLGVSSRRSELVHRFSTGMSAGWAVVVHARAHVSPTAQIQEGTLVCAGAIVNPGAVVGAHVIANTGAIIEHDVQLGDFVQLAPGVVLGGGVSVGEGTFLGLGCRVRDHIQIGRRVTVGMGAVVIGSVADDACVMGVPARLRGTK